ncbi:hypothetical protein GHK92_05295 [Nocardioides sp. dk4132]|uniref:hypothetical protein n=1 Tax=unclassified Nocardioides TaxID=2615069 RepID=UPI001295C180|nr:MULTISPECIES: hypothetical protein [unclassified Nocardioides]MQW75283.1 hypothetical protein [Nocardioides sp. dk4132]
MPPPEPERIRASAGTVGLLTALLSCGACRTAVRVDAAAETLRHGRDRTPYPLRVTEDARSWVLEWTCPGCTAPSVFHLPKLLPDAAP